jgi:general secretion pathway protein A
MYESHFGFSGSPFQLNPDPAFYFDSRGHSNALAYLKFGAHQGEGFIVVTGEIGAGKTTLVRTLLEGLNPDQVVAAQVVSTQLESSELLQAILMAFGVGSNSTSKAHLIASLEAFLTGLAAKGRRALLIIDEAQNLRHEAVEELRMLSNFQLGKYGLLQSFLVGQPELRGLLQSKSMEQLRQRVIASCHLGPLDQAETRAYIEHRLRRVGWNGETPKFEAGALDRIHYWTGGVPRKINRQCNRMLLGAFLANAGSISLALVDETATELRNEIGEAPSVAIPQPPNDAPVAATTAAAAPSLTQPAPALAAAPLSAIAAPDAPLTAASDLPPAIEQRAEPVAGTDVPAATPAPVQRSAASQAAPDAPAAPPIVATMPKAPNPMVIRRVHKALGRDNPLVCIVNSTADYMKAGTLQAAFEGLPSLPDVAALHLGSAAEFWSDELETQGAPPMPALGIHLGLGDDLLTTRMAAVIDALNRALDDLGPRAVLVLGNSDSDLAAALVANERGLPVLRVGSGYRGLRYTGGELLNAGLIERIADLHFTDSTESFYALYREGIRLDRVRSVGSLTHEMLEHALTLVDAAPRTSRQWLSERVQPDDERGFGLVSVDAAVSRLGDDSFAHLLALLCDYSKVRPLVWLAHGAVRDRLQTPHHAAALNAARISVAPRMSYLESLTVLRQAHCLIAMAKSNLLDEAQAWRLPTLMLRLQPVIDARSTKVWEPGTWRLDEVLADVAPVDGSPDYWNTGTAARIAVQLVAWLPTNLARREPAPSNQRMVEVTT